MRLSELIRQGAKLSGLAPLLNSGKPASDGSWSNAGNELTFYPDNTGTNPVVLLPYREGMNASTPMGGREVISGPFDGCVMGIYRTAGGPIQVNHVDTSLRDNKRQCKEDWKNQKGAAGFDLLCEFSTQGLIADFLSVQDAKAKEDIYSAGNKFVGVCVADPTTNTVTFGLALKEGNLYTIVQSVRGQNRPMT